MIEYIEKIGHIDLDDVSAVLEPKKPFTNAINYKIKIVMKNGPIIESEELSEEAVYSIHEKIIKAWQVSRKTL